MDVENVNNNNNNNHNNNKYSNNNNNNNSNKIDFAWIINELLYLPPVQLHQQSTNKTSIQSQASTTQKNQPIQQHLFLLITDSLIFNLYARSKKMDKLRLNNSFFNSSVSMMSMSQMSDQWSQHNYSVINNNNCNQNDLLKLALMYIQMLVNSDVFYKRLKVYYDRQGNKLKNHHYLQNLLQTLQYILNKQKLPLKQHFIKQRNMHFKTFLHSSTPVTFVPNQGSLEKINSILFTDQLDKILVVIAQAQNNSGNNSNNNNNNISYQQLLFSLNRVYFVAKKAQTRKHFRSIKHTSQDMFFNLTKLYINSFSSKLSTLQQSKHPIFMLLKTHLFVFHMPVFKAFTDMVLQLTKCYNANVVVFYQQNQQVLQRVVNKFIDELPLELIEFLSMLNKLVEARHLVNNNSNISPIINRVSLQHATTTSKVNNKEISNEPTNNVSSLIPIKRFLIYSFLCDPQLIKQFVFNYQQQQSVSNSNSTNSNINKPTTTTPPFSPLPPPLSTQPQHSLQHYQQVCNYIINLFFSSSIKKYTTNYTLQQLTPLIQLSQSIQRKLQQRILSYTVQAQQFYYYDQQSSPSMLESYFIQQPILNYDYMVLERVIDVVEFTPKDDKRYQIVSYMGVGNNNSNNLNNLNSNNLNNPNININNNNYNYNKSKQHLNNNNTNTNNNIIINPSSPNSRILQEQPNYNHNQLHMFKNTFCNNNLNNNLNSNNRQQTQPFIKNTQPFHRQNNKRQLTLSPNKFSFIEQKQSLNATLTGQSFFTRGQHHLTTTPGFYQTHSYHHQQFQQDFKNNNSIEYENEIDLLTWMTIGGTHNYKQKVSAKRIKLSKTLNLQHNRQYDKIGENQIQSQKQKQKYYSNNNNKYQHLQNSPKHLNNKQYEQQQQSEDNQCDRNRKQQNKPILTTTTTMMVNNNNNNKKRRQFKTFNKQKVKQINRLYEQYASKNVYV